MFRQPGRGGIRGGGEQLAVNAAFIHPLSSQPPGHLGDHRLGAAQEKLVNGPQVQQALDQFAALAVVDAAVQKRDVLALPAEDVKPLEPGHVAILDRLQLLLEHDRGGALVAVQQGDAAGGLAPQSRLDDGKNRRDAASRRDAQVIARVVLMQRREEVALGRHDLDDIAAPQFFIGEGGKRPSRHSFDGDPQFVFIYAGANGVRAGHQRAVDGRPQGQVLALGEAEALLQLRRRRQGQAHRVVCFRPDGADGQGMKSRHVTSI